MRKEKRPVFIPVCGAPYYREVYVEFLFDEEAESLEEKRKNITALHQGFRSLYPESKVLEISTRSMQPEGEALSAFNLKRYVPDKRQWFPVENVYQSAKVFENGENYPDLLYVSPREAKKDQRLTGKVTAYYFEGYEYPFEHMYFPAEPKDAFFNYIYWIALLQNPELCEKMLVYDAFTDIEFDPATGTNCQARAAAEFVGRKRSGMKMSLSEIENIMDQYVKERDNMSNIPEKLNREPIDRLISLYREDAEMLEVLEEGLLAFEEYHSSVYTMETKLRFLSPQSMEREEYQSTVEKMDAHRSACHEALLTAVSVLNRLAEKENLPPVYGGTVSREQPYRRQVANAVFAYVEEIVRERR